MPEYDVMEPYMEVIKLVEFRGFDLIYASVMTFLLTSMFVVLIKWLQNEYINLQTLSLTTVNALLFDVLLCTKKQLSVVMCDLFPVLYHSERLYLQGAVLMFFLSLFITLPSAIITEKVLGLKDGNTL